MLRQPWSMLDDDGTAVALPSPKVPESQFFAIVDMNSITPCEITHKSTYQAHFSA